jgi:ferredoxin
MALKPTVDKNLCIACGHCIQVCDACFEWGDDGKSQVKESCDDRKCDLQDAADNCPVAAISIEEV